MMKSGKAVGPDNIPVGVWKCLRESAFEFLTKLYNRTMESERMPEEWRESVLGAVLLTVGRSYVGNDVTHSTLLDRACACSYENLPKYRSYRVSKTAPRYRTSRTRAVYRAAVTTEA